MKERFTLDDVTLEPQFSEQPSRSKVDTSVEFLGNKYRLPIVSSNMDTVTGSDMARAMLEKGAAACLHRFLDVPANVKEFLDGNVLGEKPWVSIGIGEKELERAKALREVGAEVFVLDVAHGASQLVVDQAQVLRKALGDYAKIVVGNFANEKSLKEFLKRFKEIDAIKVGIGSGSHCTTRIVTGCGVPLLSSVLECASSGIPIIADGGIRNSGDIVKCLAAGAGMVMLGRLLSGTSEAPGETSRFHIMNNGERLSDTDDTINLDDATARSKINNYKSFKDYNIFVNETKKFKKYRGSASQESYGVQGKLATWRAPEGESSLVPYTGSVHNILDNLEGGIRSGMTYNNAWTLQDLTNCEFSRVTNAGIIENGAHGKK